MIETSQKIKDMLAAGYQLAPKAQLKIDLDPPFVGQDFQADGCDPALYEQDGSLWLVFVDTAAGGIKIVSLNQSQMKVDSLIRFISESGARMPSLCFEPSTYPGRPDLPHVIYRDTTTGKIMVYREQYDAEGNPLPITDEIGTGSGCATVRSGDRVIDFYLSGGNIYSRIQGEYASILMEPASGETITSFAAVGLPDYRIAICHTVQTGTGYEYRIAYTELIGIPAFDDQMQCQILTKELLFKYPVIMEESLCQNVETLSLLIKNTFYVIDNPDLLCPNISATSLVLTFLRMWHGYTEDGLQSQISINSMRVKVGLYNSGEDSLQTTLSMQLLQID